MASREELGLLLRELCCYTIGNSPNVPVELTTRIFEALVDVPPFLKPTGEVHPLVRRPGHHGACPMCGTVGDDSGWELGGTRTSFDVRSQPINPDPNWMDHFHKTQEISG